MSENKRRCCNLGCKNEFDTRNGLPQSGWYKTGYGFMCWSCPEHAQTWMQFDKERKAYRDAKDIAYMNAYKEFEDRFEADFTATNPPIIAPENQSSL